MLKEKIELMQEELYLVTSEMAAGAYSRKELNKSLIAIIELAEAAIMNEELERKMDFKEYSQLASRTFGVYKDPYDMLMNGALGLAGESGEVADIVKKWKFQGHDLDLDKVEEELGDVLWYINLATAAVKEIGYETSLKYVAIKNIEKLEKRYPNNEFSTEASIRRVDTDE